MSTLKQTPKMWVTTNADDIALVKRLKRNLQPSLGALTNTALVRLALRNLAENRGVKA